MKDPSFPIDPELVREACAEAAVRGYEDASFRGLCHEGAWEAAVSAIRRVDLGGLGAAPAAAGAPAMEHPPAGEPLNERIGHLAQQFSAPGAPAAGAAAAATGAVAAGLLEWAAGLSEERGPAEFRERARAIRSRAVVLRSALASAGEKDAQLVGAMLRNRSRDGATEARRRATGSLLEIGERCAQVATLALEVATHGHEAIRPDVAAARRLAGSGSECALDLADENLRPEEDQEWARLDKRRAWRARLLLQRAAPPLRGE